ncbi:hypothetical protein HDV00_002987 [Rhizophlyctis rosea]|nr:hypothetical protein HDV00_002987 [Rhizophlyctis rosea]
MLRDLGAELDIDLPRICVAGNQFAGKSSLIEAISEVALPRSDGTCTRCPMEVRLSEPKADDEEEWSCSIRLRIVQDGKQQPLPTPQEVEFDEVLLEKNEVGEALWAAQRAVLKPTSVLAHEGSASDLRELFDDENMAGDLRFTENTVVVNIVGKDLGYLTLIDLPGIIHATDTRRTRCSSN